MLEVTRVTNYYDALAAVRDVTFTARPGEVLGYLGPNGSGKSTTVKMVTGLLTPSSGVVTYQGRDIQEELLAHRRRIGYVPEAPELYTYLTGPEYLTLIGRLAADRRSGAREKDRTVPPVVGYLRRPLRFTVGVFERDEAEDPHLGRAAARSGDHHPRRAVVRPRRRLQAGAEAAHQGAGLRAGCY